MGTEVNTPSPREGTGRTGREKVLSSLVGADTRRETPERPPPRVAETRDTDGRNPSHCGRECGAQPPRGTVQSERRPIVRPGIARLCSHLRESETRLHPALSGELDGAMTSAAGGRTSRGPSRQRSVPEQ